jgi:hypothetical protein
MSEPSLTTLKRLFARSGNQCAFPGCILPITETTDTVTGVICHIHARNPNGPRYDSSQTDEDRHGFGNLILLCARHSKIIDTEVSTYSADELRRMKKEHEAKTEGVEICPATTRSAEALQRQYGTIYNIRARGPLIINSPGAVQESHVTIRTGRPRVNVLPAAGTIGSAPDQRNYIQHLVSRYNEFASQQARDRGYSHAAIYGRIKTQFKASWQHVPLSRFPELVTFLQQRIDATKLGRINRAKAIRNYSSFVEFCHKHGSPISVPTPSA